MSADNTTGVNSVSNFVLQEVGGPLAAWNGHSSAAYHTPPNYAGLAVRVADWQRGIQDKRNSRNHWRFGRCRVRDASQFNGKGRDGVWNQRRHHPVHLPHLLRYARGRPFFSFCLDWKSACSLHNTFPTNPHPSFPSSPLDASVETASSR